MPDAYDSALADAVLAVSILYLRCWDLAAVVRELETRGSFNSLFEMLPVSTRQDSPLRPVDEVSILYLRCLRCRVR